jgi:hypothetical protein
MTRHMWMGLGAAALVVLAVPAAAAPADTETALAQVPAGSPIIVQIHGIERTKERLFALIKNALPEVAPIIEEKIEDGIKKGLEGREIKGLAKDGPIFVAFTEMPKPGENPPKIAVILKATNYADFRDGILKEEERKALKPDPSGFEETTIDNEPAYFVDRKGYAIVTPNKDVAVQFTKKQAGSDGKLDKTIAKRLLDADVGVYVDIAAVRKAYGEDIKRGREQLEKSLEEMTKELGGTNKTNLEMAKLVIGPLFQAFEDGRDFVFSIDLPPEGLALHAEVTVAADSKTNLLLKASKPTSMAELSGLPGERTAYTAMHLAPALVKDFGPFVYGIISDPESKEGKTLRDAVLQIAESKPKLRLDATAFPPGGLQVWSYEDPARAATSQLKLFESLREGESYNGTVIKEKPEIKPDAKKHRGFNLHYVSLAWDLEATVAKSLPGGRGIPVEFQAKMAEGMKKLAGEGQKAWFGSDGKAFVWITAKDWETAQKTLDNYLDKKGAIGEVAAFTDTRKRLPAETTLLSLVDLPSYAAVMAEYFQSIIPEGTPFPAEILKPAVKGKPAFMGMSITLQPERGSVDFYLPANAVNELYKMFGEAIKKAASGGAGN